MFSRLIFACLVLGLSRISQQDSKHDGFQSTLGHIKPRSTPEVQAQAARDVAERLLGFEKSKLFLISIDTEIGPPDKDTFSISKNTFGQVEITGTSGVAASWGLHYYLKTFCNVHISWDGNQLHLPNTLPGVHVKITSNDRFRYYQNVCTAGYSSVWWQWEQWEKNIDWMALNGINLALAFTGQEAIWEKVYLHFNLTRDEIDEHFGGPAFLPWARMGNIRGFGGPLGASWHRNSIRLQFQILRRMRELGIIPVLPAFAGHVPRAFAKHFPNANMTKVDVWNHFEDKYCCPFLLEPTDPLFLSVGEKFLQEYIELFGTDHIYSSDTFNENEPGNSELAYLRNVGRSVYTAMTNVDAGAIWLMQGWLFVHHGEFWTKPRVEAFLTSIPTGKMIVLDLQSEQFPQYSRLNSYYGQPFIWCMLHNFGGTLGLFGSARIINHRVFEARNMEKSTMVGTGLTPEGINQNFVIYDLMTEMAYRREPVDLNAWFAAYSTRRYAAWNEYAVAAWKSLSRTVYNFHGDQKIRGKYTLTRRPSLTYKTWTWYKREEFISTWGTFLKARYGRENSTLYRHDVVDLTRQALQLRADDVYLALMDSRGDRNVTKFRMLSHVMLELFDDLELILASGENFLLGKWLEDAKNAAVYAPDRQLFEYNARSQITLWGPRGEIRDYANKQWSGVIADYFKPRWVVFLAAIEDSLVHNTYFNVTDTNVKMFERVEQPFTLSKKTYPIAPRGDSIEIALRIYSKWHAPIKHSNKRLRFRRKGARRHATFKNG